METKLLISIFIIKLNKVYGGERGIRTLGTDIVHLFSRQASSTTPAPLHRYLSAAGFKTNKNAKNNQNKLVHPTRFELMTFGSASQRSIQLSYGCIRLVL